ncbi:MAG: hypothetical protein COA71_10615 [SAR86 cluster bacterium]|uniref:Flippase-like domain-containing protein n=1 Tax=SAR86 cluster bacterium TaxID=2030880 RepID=A0A2A5CAS8_9GAMM|nr:MAG: hypothetical protein COA71_10615 [SAR86 cluster bacterium]
MVEIENKNLKKSRFQAIIWPALYAFILLSVILALNWFFSLKIDYQLFKMLSYQWLAAAILMQGLVIIVFIMAWQYNLRLHGLSQISFLQSSLMIGINSIGKYTPGKILGVVARGSALYKMAGDGRLVVQATLVEQLALVHSGIVVAALFWLVDKGNILLALLVLGLALISVFLMARFDELVVNTTFKLLRRTPVALMHIGFRKSYKLVFVLMALMWVLSAMTLYLLMIAFGVVGGWSISALIWITVMAYLSGFLAFFTPAGLGVREGVIVALLSVQMGVGVAVSISILHRLITLLFDFLLGCLALFLGKSYLIAPIDKSD